MSSSGEPDLELAARPHMPPEADAGDAGADLHGVEMDRDVAADWELWSEQIGRALLPILQQVVDATPTVTAAMVCTADGFNLCSLGLEEEDVNRVSAMTSSLHSLASTVTGVVDKPLDHPLDMVSMSHGTRATVVLAVRHLVTGQLLLWLTGEAEMLGILLVRARAAAVFIREMLADD